MASKSANRYSPEFRERAVRMLLEQRGEYRSEHATPRCLAPKIGSSTGQPPRTVSGSAGCLPRRYRSTV